MPTVQAIDIINAPKNKKTGAMGMVQLLLAYLLSRAQVKTAIAARRLYLQNLHAGIPAF